MPSETRASTGTLALWHSGPLALWHSGTLALWHSGTPTRAAQRALSAPDAPTSDVGRRPTAPFSLTPEGHAIPPTITLHIAALGSRSKNTAALVDLSEISAHGCFILSVRYTDSISA
ncbi:unnamed protein product, partial [Iphiclides podalirius]